jgi:hypothetical protein
MLLEKHRLKKIYFAFDLCSALGPPRLEFSACRFPAMPNEVLEVMLDHSTTLQLYNFTAPSVYPLDFTAPDPSCGRTRLYSLQLTLLHSFF